MPVGKGNTDTGRGSVQLSHLGVDLRLSGGETSPHLQVANPSDRRLSRKGRFPLSSAETETTRIFAFLGA